MVDGAEHETSSVSTALLRVHGVLGEVGRAHDLDELLGTVARATLAHLGASAVSISRLDVEQGHLRTLHNAGDLAPWEESHPEAEVYTAAAYPTLLNRIDRPTPWRAAVDDPGTNAAEIEVLRQQGKSVGLGLPVTLRRQVWGEIYATRTAKLPFSDTDVAAGQVLSAAMSLGIDRLTGHGELLRLAYIDPLTGLANRRRADEVVDQALDESRQVAVALFDVDGMKTVNDRDGHAAGDRLLMRVGILLSEAAGSISGAIAARLGGDEFALLCVDTDRVKVAELAASVVAQAATLATGSGLSAGLADSSALLNASSGAKAVYRRADAALYRAKRAGGSQLVQGRTPGDPHAPVAAETQIVRDRPVITTDGVTKSLMGDPHERLAMDALTAVGLAVTERIDGAAWWLSMALPDSDHLVGVASGIDRSPSSGATISPVGTVYRLSDFPETTRVCGGGHSIARLHDPAIDQSEADFLAELGYTANLMAGATDPTGRRWLLEIFIDVLSDEPVRVGPDLAQLVREAVGQPSPAELSVDTPDESALID